VEVVALMGSAVELEEPPPAIKRRGINTAVAMTATVMRFLSNRVKSIYL
jgi:hypothetical protein